MKYTVFMVVVLMILTGPALAADTIPQIPPSPFTQTPVSKVKATKLAEFEAPYFLECAHSRDDGSIVFTSHNDGRLYHYVDNTSKVIADIAGKMTCLEPIDKQRYLITAWNEENESVLYMVDITGNIQEIKVPGGQFLNGIVSLDSNHFLIADSFKGVIWQYTLDTQAIDVWHDHALIKRQSPDQKFPGINGLQRQGNTLYFANNAGMFIGRIQLDHNNKPGKTEVYKSSVLIDDFVVDDQHNIYGATHIYDSVIHITPNGDVTIIADAEEGVIGSTSVSWATNKKDLIVTTNGGLFARTPQHAEPAKLIKLEL